MSKYQKYRLRWMIEHGHSIKELIEVLQELQNEAREDMEEPTVKELFDRFLEVGFNGGEIWVCKGEWKANENA